MPGLDGVCLEELAVGEKFFMAFNAMTDPPSLGQEREMGL